MILLFFQNVSKSSRNNCGSKIKEINPIVRTNGQVAARLDESKICRPIFDSSTVTVPDKWLVVYRNKCQRSYWWYSDRLLTDRLVDCIPFLGIFKLNLRNFAYLKYENDYQKVCLPENTIFKYISKYVMRPRTLNRQIQFYRRTEK